MEKSHYQDLTSTFPRTILKHLFIYRMGEDYPHPLHLQMLCDDVFTYSEVIRVEQNVSIPNLSIPTVANLLEELEAEKIIAISRLNNGCTCRLTEEGIKRYCEEARPLLMPYIHPQFA